MALQSLLQCPTSLEEEVQFPLFLLLVDEGKFSADVGNYIEVSRYIHKVCSRKDICDYIYRGIK